MLRVTLKNVYSAMGGAKGAGKALAVLQGDTAWCADSDDKAYL